MVELTVKFTMEEWQMHPLCIVDQVRQHSIAILINVRRIVTACTA